MLVKYSVKTSGLVLMLMSVLMEQLNAQIDQLATTLREVTNAFVTMASRNLPMVTIDARISMNALEMMFSPITVLKMLFVPTHLVPLRVHALLVSMTSMVTEQSVNKLTNALLEATIVMILLPATMLISPVLMVSVLPKASHANVTMDTPVMALTPVTTLMNALMVLLNVLQILLVLIRMAVLNATVMMVSNAQLTATMYAKISTNVMMELITVQIQMPLVQTMLVALSVHVILGTNSIPTVRNAVTSTNVMLTLPVEMKMPNVPIQKEALNALAKMDLEQESPVPIRMNVPPA